MSFEEELHNKIDEWDLYVVEKMQLEEDMLQVFNSYEQRVKEAIERMADCPSAEALLEELDL